jgi:hypothetical protein
MHKASLALILVAMTGCSSNQMHFEQRSELSSRVSSLALYDDGQDGVGSMNEQTCKFDAINGFIISDIDLPTATETIQDVRGTVAIGLSAEGIHVLDENGWDKDNDIAIAGVKHARMTENGVASLISDESGCRVDWRNDDTNLTASLSADVCATATDFAVDRVSGQAFVAYGTDVVTATQDGGVTAIGVAGDLLAIDEVTGNVSIAKRGGQDITTVSTVGDVQWTTSVRGTVHALSDFGARGATAVVVDHGSDASIEAFDAGDGSSIADYSMPSVADITVSADASTVGLITEDTAYFYDVFEGAAPVVFNEVETEPPPMFAD